ncbi:MAG: HAMP domain-containing histidine kinase [Melioribacteraceae bacterium]|nr:HAMP domain-containing histidine kinase [Melioribacteraceae bacterium]
MNKALKQIIAGLSTLIALPLIIILFMQFNSLNENERFIEEAYNEQLETIIFSINQYSQDILKDWQRDINSIILYSDLEKSDKEIRIKNLFQNNKPIKAIFIIGKENISLHVNDEKERDSISAIIDGLKPTIDSKKNYLSKYLDLGYNRIEPLFSNDNSSFLSLIFLVPNNNGETNIHGMIIDSRNFITETLAPKIQEVIKGKFISQIEDIRDSSLVYTNEPELEKIKMTNKKTLWLIPFYNLGISLKGETISNLVADRLSYNYIILVFTLIIIFIAAGFVFYNIKKEMKLAQLKSDFVSNVSHELKTPLALISMFSETLEMDRIKSEEKKKEYYSIIHKETNRLSRIVSSILNFSKMEAGKRIYKVSENNLNEIIQLVIDTYEFHLTNKGFKCKFDKHDLDSTMFDGEAISEAVINLIDNAIKYSLDKKEIVISTGQDKDYIYFQVEDFGIGISNDERTKIFDKFFRATSGNVHNTKGTGLGLSIVKNIVDSHSGKIELKSEVGKGSVFKISLPKIKLWIKDEKDISC